MTNFGLDALNITLTRSLTVSFDGDVRLGTVLSQQFVIENAGATTNFDFIRYLDGDLEFDDSIDDAGGRITVGGSEVLFETDSASDGTNTDTFVGISRSVGGMTEPTEAQNFEIDVYSDLQNKILSGQNLGNTIEGDDDNDGFTDENYDVTLAQQNFFRILENQTVVYTTNTLFGNAVPPAPGSIEALPLLPDSVGPDGGFVFELDAREIVVGETIFIDPIIAMGYTSGTTFASVTAPSFGVVPDPDGYTLTFGATSVFLASGSTYNFGAGVTNFTITGIDTGLALDPTNPAAFVTGVSLNTFSSTSIVITQTPIETYIPDPSPVPLPAGVWLIGTALAGLGFVSRRRRVAA
ncbi:VPLPA-CTERM protein sorting domain-containing protein [Poseidonocella pacifica]|uniref:VPLPA-CTERM protein sorting domain-containing protein n=1 Tax=Poseidonocella pacifica TaxID=871651 RepID=A0A1I0WGI9_9RHOB|nr:VPLPA-CTERM sorting domain-containing protein [Poseidonocella pacifica]SFA87862.1 VPLPA-CTERM protein sorting domain-containing protein [Poseidonocella pacifica]